MIELPILRWGRPYQSVDRVVVPHFRTREPFVAMSQANVGLIRRDLLRQGEQRARLEAIPVADLVAAAHRAAESFLHDTLPLGESSGQTPQDYVEQVSATTGMPWASVRRNMAKVHGVLSRVEEVLAGLTRGLDLSLVDSGVGVTGGHMLSFFARADALGVVLPSNSPGVHSLWAPATVLKMPLVLKPGSAEPWTPFRIIQVREGRRAGRGLRLLPGRPRRRQRDPAFLRPRHGVWRRRLHEALEGRPACRGARPRGTARSSSARTRRTTGSATSR